MLISCLKVFLLTLFATLLSDCFKQLFVHSMKYNDKQWVLQNLIKMYCDITMSEFISFYAPCAQTVTVQSNIWEMCDSNHPVCIVLSWFILFTCQLLMCLQKNINIYTLNINVFARSTAQYFMSCPVHFRMFSLVSPTRGCHTLTNYKSLGLCVWRGLWLPII